MATKVANVNDYDIDAIEKKMEKMSSETANKLGEPTKKPQVKKDNK